MATDGDGRTATIYDLQPDPKAKVNVRRLPRLAHRAVRILWEAARPDFLLSTGMQVIGGLGLTVQLLLGQRARSRRCSVPPAAAGRWPTWFPGRPRWH